MKGFPSTLNVPNNYPTKYDEWESVLLPHIGHVIVIKPKNKQTGCKYCPNTCYVCTAQLSIEGLKKAEHLAHHNIKTKPPDSSRVKISIGKRVIRFHMKSVNFLANVKMSHQYHKHGVMRICY
jgi:hypothetical protein